MGKEKDEQQPGPRRAGGAGINRRLVWPQIDSIPNNQIQKFFIDAFSKLPPFPRTFHETINLPHTPDLVHGWFDKCV